MNSTGLLQGQLEATSDHTGAITFTGLMLTAAPGLYVLNVSLPDYPQVSQLPTQLLCSAYTGSKQSCISQLHIML